MDFPDISTASACVSLLTLDLSSNLLTAVPAAVLSQRALHSLQLNHNAGITQLPEKLGDLRCLRLLGLAGLPLETPANAPDLRAPAALHAYFAGSRVRSWLRLPPSPLLCC